MPVNRDLRFLSPSKLPAMGIIEIDGLIPSLKPHSPLFAHRFRMDYLLIYELTASTLYQNISIPTEATMMKKNTYTPAKDIDGKDLYCPVASGAEPAEHSAPDLSDCVEKDVTERYSGNIEVTK